MGIQGSLFDGEPSGTVGFRSLDEMARAVSECTACVLSQRRTRTVFGSGNPRAALLFVGEAPGENEDLQGLPFVGRAGELLTKMIEAIHLRRDDVYICNVVKCRPPENRQPEPDEIEACNPFLRSQIRLVGPKVICALGAPATKTLTGQKIGIFEARGRWYSYEGVPLLPTFHPAFLLRDPRRKVEAWEDLKAIRKRLEEAGSLPPVFTAGGQATSP